jgi:hypothetical protein
MKVTRVYKLFKFSSHGLEIHQWHSRPGLNLIVTVSFSGLDLRFTLKGKQLIYRTYQAR